MARRHGVVAWFNPEKGFGFIRRVLRLPRPVTVLRVTDRYSS
ncbi:hypothetical protein F3087_11365 [Nocardia colli]|uniref:Uncharacterized protein n=1 Tax=Nocardia colli TaxID=2545717 RepID=A0A5N0EL19_9NOCA|nr:hypothetical protein F3087_11365 [Nocardia colli]